MTTCGKCFKQVSRTSKDKIYCTLCKGYYHGSCFNLREAEIEVISAGGRWLCDSCNRRKRLSRSNSDSFPVDTTASAIATASLSPTGSAHTMALTMDILKPLLDELKKEILDGQNKIEKALGNSINQCFTRIQENNDLIANQQKIIQEQQAKLLDLEAENRDLKCKVKELSKRQNDLEQYSRRNTVEIFGVPEPKNETNAALKKTVLDIGVALGVTLTEDSIDACHRINGGNNRPTSGIIVKFVRREDPDNLLAKRKVKRDFSTRHLAGHTTDSPVYINTSLSQDRRVLLAKARRLRSDHGFKYVWADRVGRVKVRKDDGSAIKVLDDADDLQALIQSLSKKQ